MYKLNELGFAHDVLAVAFVAIVAISGAGYLVASHADSPTPVSTYIAPSSSGANVQFFNSAVAQLSGGAVASDGQVNNLGDQPVSLLPPGGQVTYTQSTVAIGTACYYVAVVGTKGETTSVAKIELNNGYKTSNRQLNLNPAGTSYYIQECVGGGTQANNLGFNVANLSPTTGPNVLVYQEMLVL